MQEKFSLVPLIRMQFKKKEKKLDGVAMHLLRNYFDLRCQSVLFLHISDSSQFFSIVPSMKKKFCVCHYFYIRQLLSRIYQENAQLFVVLYILTKAIPSKGLAGVQRDTSVWWPKLLLTNNYFVNFQQWTCWWYPMIS